MTIHADSAERLDATVAALIKSMLLRGDKQQDIAAFFGLNGGRVAEINTGQRYPEVAAAPADGLPPPGPYDAPVSMWRVRGALEYAHDAISQALAVIHHAEQHGRDR